MVKLHPQSKFLTGVIFALLLSFSINHYNEPTAVTQVAAIDQHPDPLSVNQVAAIDQHPDPLATSYLS